MITPPIILVSDDGSLDFYQSIESAMKYVNPQDVENGAYGIAFDAIGRLVSVRVDRPERTLFFPWLRFKGYEFVIETVEDEPGHAEELRTALYDFLTSTNEEIDDDEADLSNAPLGDVSLEVLVALGREHARIH